MIDLEFVERLIRAVDESGLDSVEIERGGTRIRISRTPPAPPPAAPAPWAQGAGSGPAPGSAEAEAGAAAAAATVAAGEEAAAEERETARRENLVEVTSPMVGTFYRSPAPDAPAYVEEGTRVAVGETLCIIEAMKLMNELESEISGTVVEILAENADPVEYGQPLFLVDPS